VPVPKNIIERNVYENVMAYDEWSGTEQPSKRIVQ